MKKTHRQLEALIIQYTPLLHTMIRKRITKDYHDGLDAYQDICCHLWEYIPRNFKPDRGALFVYFRQCVINSIRSYRYRKRRRQLEPPRYREHYTDRMFGIIWDQDSALSEFLMTKVTSDRQRDIICLCMEGYGPTEISKCLKISRTCVNKHLRRFRKILQESIEDVHI